jgi:flagellar FliL protein
MSAEAMEEEGGGEGQPEVKRFAGKKLVLFIILPVLIVIGAIAGVFFSGILSKPPPKPEPVAGQEEPPPQKPAPRQTVFFDMPDLIVNLNTGTSATRRTNFLKISVSLELENPGDIELVTQNMPRIIDNFQRVLPSRVGFRGGIVVGA